MSSPSRTIALFAVGLFLLAAPAALGADIDAAVGPPTGQAACGCSDGQSTQQPPWHGNVRAAQYAGCPGWCRGSNVYQAHPFEQLHWRQYGCFVLPPAMPRLHALCREGYLPSPTPPAMPRCHQCGAPIEGGF